MHNLYFNIYIFFIFQEFKNKLLNIKKKNNNNKYSEYNLCIEIVILKILKYEFIIQYFI